ncbi:MAG: hypothetical protein KIT46_02195 [Anaerolineales bacterium]|nr:hypothetical protein [Anaerolineales bacterium]MCW5854836.1 hypothetical protein [Anaerolineales bacterium]
MSATKKTTVHKGLPKPVKHDRILKYLGYFVAGGVLLALLILLFKDSLALISAGLRQGGNFMYLQIVVGGLISILVAAIQVGVFRQRVKSRQLLFVGLAGAGGLLGGLVAGWLLDSYIIVDGFSTGAIVGGVMGLVAGYTQTLLMSRERSVSTWVTYNSLSSAIIYAVGWQIGWGYDASKFAAGAFFVMLGAGLALVVFLNNFQQDLEFS